MWLHESESNSIITEAYENKIFLTIIYISNYYEKVIKSKHQCMLYIYSITYNIARKRVPCPSYFLPLVGRVPGKI